MRNIASRYGMSEAAVCRHKRHVAVSIAKAVERRGERSGDKILARLDELDEETWQLMQTMKQEGDLRGAIVGAREVRGCIETRAGLMVHEAKVQALNDPGAITCIVVDLAGENPATPKSLP